MPAPATTNPASVTTVTTVKSEPNPGEPKSARSARADRMIPPATAFPRPAPDARPDNAAKSHGDWMIQVGAFDSETEAHERLNTVAQQQGQEVARPSQSAHRKGGQRRQDAVTARALPGWRKVRRKRSARASSAAKFPACCCGIKGAHDRAKQNTQKENADNGTAPNQEPLMVLRQEYLSDGGEEGFPWPH